MLHRICEPPPEDARFEAQAYLAMDHTAVNRAFVDDLLATGSVGPRVLDVGCGPALIPILLCEVAEEIDWVPRLQVMAVDSCVEMLELARFELEFAGRIEQILLEQVDLTDPAGLQREIVDTVICNTVLHHLQSPLNAIRLSLRALRPGGRLFFRDLVRPENQRDLETLVDRYFPPLAGKLPNSLENDPPDQIADNDPTDTTDEERNENEFQRQLLRQSLHASFTLAEVQDTVAGLGIDAASVKMTSDRHWTLDYVCTPTADPS